MSFARCDGPGLRRTHRRRDTQHVATSPTSSSQALRLRRLMEAARWVAHGFVEATGDATADLSEPLQAWADHHDTALTNALASLGATVTGAPSTDLTCQPEFRTMLRLAAVAASARAGEAAQAPSSAAELLDRVQRTIWPLSETFARVGLTRALISAASDLGAITSILNPHFLPSPWSPHSPMAGLAASCVAVARGRTAVDVHPAASRPDEGFGARIDSFRSDTCKGSTMRRSSTPSTRAEHR
jgi:hypothetical protein